MRAGLEIFCNKEEAKAKGKASPSSPRRGDHPGARRKAILEALLQLLGTAQGARDDEQRREERAEQQAPAPQGPVLPPPPPVDYGVFMQGLVQAMQTQAHTQAALQAQLEAQRADVWWSSLLRTRFEDGAVDVAWDAFVRLFRAKFVPEHIQDKMEQEFLSLTQGSMTVLEDERRKTKKFVMGLKPSLRTRLVAFDHRMLDEALSAACR
ncbi:hypothetical protein Taro_016925 [Colocasia esculenta]|uniref:Retrotransposon gag domain-containing protein n=1 Tax=Colocasia esculenta TaxID=4460 RepID=A0A843UQ30_COLES|nr:hypothetical protein [Colocasia esculenta]